MSEKAKQFEFKEGEFVVTGWAEGQMEVEREDDRGNKVTVMQPYFQLFVLSPCSSFKSENYGASGLKAEKRKCSTNAVWANLHPMEVVNLYFDEKKRVVMAVSTGRAVQLDEVSFYELPYTSRVSAARRRVAPSGVTPPLTGGHYLQYSRLGGSVWMKKRTSFFMTGYHLQARSIPRRS